MTVCSKRMMRRPALLGLLACVPSVAAAQSVQTYFPSGNAGYDQEPGVTVLTRLRPLFEPVGIRAGSFVLFPSVDQSLIGNSNVTGRSGSAAFGSDTSANFYAGSDWLRNSLSANLGVSEQVYTTDPQIDDQNWNVGLGGGYTIGREQLTLDYSHQTTSELGTSIGTVATTTPILDQTDTANSAYTFDFGSFSLTPDVSGSLYRFGNATVDGQTVNQSFLDRDVYSGSLIGRYAMDEEGSLVAIVQGVSSNFVRNLPGQPAQSSHSELVLAGVDYQAKGVWRYQFLAGVERRDFSSAAYAPRTAPILEGNLIWSPTPLTTVTGTVSRLIDDPQAGGTNGFVLTDLRLVADHEFLPYLTGELRGDTQIAEYLQGGSQTAFTLGGGVDLLLNRRIRISFDFDYTQQNGTFQPTADLGPTSAVTNAYRQDLASVTLHFAI